MGSHSFITGVAVSVAVVLGAGLTLSLIHI